ncbi:MAG: transcriptional repressor [Syntrophorhabdus sp.]|nr:transcriptional repressor [Syntrophorhabdus sp.]
MAEGHDSKSMKMTPQRMAIMKYLDGNTCHPSAADIHGAIREQFPTMSLATVYNTLETLKERGAVIELSIDRLKKRFDPNPEPHHHLMCIKCKAIIDVFVELPLTLSDAQTQGFEIIGNRVDFYGICKSCSDEQKGTIEKNQ